MPCRTTERTMLSGKERNLLLSVTGRGGCMGLVFFLKGNNRQVYDNFDVTRTAHLYSTDTFTFSSFTVSSEAQRERNRFAFPKINLRLPPLLTCFLLQCTSTILTFILFPIAVFWCGPPSTTHTAAVQLISWVALYTASSLTYR